MEEKFSESLFREIKSKSVKTSNNLIKSSQVSMAGSVKINVEEDSHKGVKIVLKKDENDNVKEIKFLCSCGQTKSIILDYDGE